MGSYTLHIPLDVARDKEKQYHHNFDIATRGSGRLMLFAGDQKVEHLNKDFFGENISPEDANPEHLFQIASKAKIGVFASQLGLIARYGSDYAHVPYLVKINSKTNLLPKDKFDPYSPAWYSVQDVVDFQKQSKLNILGVGYTVYLGGEYETYHLREAAQVVKQAHEQGMLAIIWMYVRGKELKKSDEQDAAAIAGAAGVGACLGADFVKVYPPTATKTQTSAQLVQQAVKAAGRTRVVCIGGEQTIPLVFLQNLAEQLAVGGTGGSATGRNIHEKSLQDGIMLCDAISALVCEGKPIEEVVKIYQ